MKVESVRYEAAGVPSLGALIYDAGRATPRPLLLMAPNWRGVIPPAIETGRMLAAEGYVVFIADMFGEGREPSGSEAPMEFLKPYIADVAGTRTRILSALDTMTLEVQRRGVGDITRRAAIGYCYGGSNVLDLARVGADLQAVVSLHGVLATAAPAKRRAVKAAVLAVHGAADPVSPKAHRDAFEDEMTAAGANWRLLLFGAVVHSFTDATANVPGVSMFNEPAMRHGYALAHEFIADAFAGRL
jgi:dienelactone hydrolase